ncbi:MAG: antibiotic biosynthesis monooxygenase [Gemmatimonadaceae bacterium]|nr:antibiotic biosynthesis monooxygenase [Gemmatimonadaceae bacterium]
MIHVIAELTIAADTRDAFVHHFRWLEPLVRHEAGCLEYRGALEIETSIEAQTPRRPDVLIVVEKWESEATLAAHLDAPHMHEFGTRTSGMLLSRTIRIAQDISGEFAGH